MKKHKNYCWCEDCQHAFFMAAARNIYKYGKDASRWPSITPRAKGAEFR